MIVIEKNEGPKIPYEVTGNKVCFDDDLTINLAKQEKDWEVHIDICENADGNLSTGTEDARYYVAQIDIPAAVYIDVPDTETPEETTREKQPLDMNTVTLTLWALHE